MHIIFERIRTRFRSNCNILALAWTPYYGNQRQSLFSPNEPSSDFGWLVLGNVGKIVGVTLTSLVAPYQESRRAYFQNNDDLIILNETDQSSNDNTTSHPDKRPDRKSMRSNYNLRGHLDEVILVKWNELYQKLATIDSKGNVLIWCKINEKFTIQTPFYNRTKSVADFKWSNDGKTALICYTDSFILVGSTSGHRHWHSMLNLEDYHITCASWTPNDEQLLLGVSNGNIVMIDLCRNELTELVVNNTNIRAMCWSTKNNRLKFDNNKKVTKNDGRVVNRRNPNTIVKHRRLSRDCSVFSQVDRCEKASQCEKSNMLAIDFANNTIKLYEACLEDPDPKTIQVNLESYIMSWSNDGKILAVAGFNVHTTAPYVGYLKCRYLNSIKFYNQQGGLIYEHTLEYTRYPITAFTWAHYDRRIFLATGPRLHCAKVFVGIPSLSLLAITCIQRNTRLADKNSVLKSLVTVNTANKQASSTCPIDWQSENCPIRTQLIGIHQSSEVSDNDTIDFNNITVAQYHLPSKLQAKIDEMFRNTIRPPYDERWSLTDIIWHVPRYDQRHYCTLICYASEREINTTSHQYRNELRDNSCRLSNNDNRISSSDQNKIFVLYVEFQGSLIPILRARRVGFLKPEFVIFDPEDNQLFRTQRQRKVSDISQQSSSNSIMQRKLETPCSSRHYNQPNQLSLLRDQSQTIPSGPAPFYYNQGFGDNCADLHLYTEPPVSNSSSFGKQSILSDAEHYYNFECDTVNKQNQEKFADLVNGRSYHQEPIALPVASNPYLLYMMQQAANKQRIQATIAGDSLNSTPSLSSIHNKRQVNQRQKMSHRSVRYGSGILQNLTENHELVRIKSNIWGTKFKLFNVENRMIKQKSMLGSVLYKASILHLQPRQIFINIKDMSNYCCLCSKHHHSKPLKMKPLKVLNKHDKVSLLDLPNNEQQFISPLRSSRSEQRRKPSVRLSKSVICSRRANNDQTMTPDRYRDYSNQHQSKVVVPDSCEQQDDILTLTLGQGDQIKVKMSSLGELNKRDSKAPREISSIANEPQMDDFLASNKTLKSIQTITKMIVDLSSKAGSDCNEEEPLSSPNKLVKLTDDSNAFDSPRRALARYMPPDTPVHRPRRIAMRQFSGDPSKERPSCSQSANTTPLKSLYDSSSTSSAKWKHHRRAMRAGHQTSNRQMIANQPLPPPPPVPKIGRRLSSSAKSFIDGSLRSLYGGYSTSSDFEPEESEPLVVGKSFGGLSKQARSRLMMNERGQSQPNSPLKNSLSSRRETIVQRQRADLISLKNQLVQRFSGKQSPSPSESNLADNNQSSKYGRAKSHRQDQAKESIGSAPLSSSSCSDLSSFDDDDDDDDYLSTSDEDLESTQTNRLACKRKSGKFSSSVKDLRELNQVKPTGQSIKPVKSKRHKRLGRKSVCMNSSCCCAKEFKLNNRPPVWNELSQIYQLDFGGRVAQESAKNLQIDFEGNLVSSNCTSGNGSVEVTC